MRKTIIAKIILVGALLLCAAAHAAEAPVSVDAALQKLEITSATRDMPIVKWKLHTDMDERCLDPHFMPDKTWQSAGISMTFPPSEKGVWMWAKVKIPKSVSGMPTQGSRVTFHAAVTKTADIFVNGQWKDNLTGGGGETLVTTNAVPGEEYVIVAHLVARRVIAAFGGPTLRFTSPDPLQQEIDYYRNNVAAIRALAPYQPDAAAWEDRLQRSAERIDFAAIDAKDTARVLASVRAARAELEPFREIAQNDFSLYLNGYSHIDLAWLWDKKEGEEVWLNTSRTILGLMNEYPEWIYSAGQAAGYEWMERDYPDLFAEIKKRVDEGRWEIVGGTWAEFDSNLPGGESYVRQLLYGKRWFREKFGKNIVVAWTPDSFGYNWNLAQIYKKAGMIGLLTQKINWNDTTRFPHNIFWWEGPDGSRLLTYFPVGSYGESLDTGAMLDQIKTVKDKHGVPENFAIFGVGDHGGGVTRTHLNRAFTFKNDPMFPKTSFITADGYFKHLLDLSKSVAYPVYSDELYLEYHRGTFTSQANTKRNNRMGEMALMSAETFASVAGLFGKEYESKPLREAWDLLMFNQFHDVLPGSSIKEVYVDADADYAKMFELANGVRDRSLDVIAKQIDTRGEGQAMVLFNPLAWARDDVAEIADPGQGTGLVDEKGGPVPVQEIMAADGSRRLLFVARRIPAAGYAVYRVTGKRSDSATAASPRASATSLENEFLAVTVDPATGNITSLIDKTTGREFFGGGKQGNMLQCFRDKHKDYDAWNIKLHEAKEVALTAAPELVENGPVRATLRWTKTVGNSTFTHYLSVVAGVPQVFGKLEVDWREEHVMAKLAFDLNLTGETAWYEIPYAAIPRAAVPKTDADRAKWEVPAQKWVDLPSADGAAGFSILNNSKYGFDTQSSVMRVSLLRSPKDPDPDCDMGRHTIEYALVPHAGDWRAAHTPRRGYEFNAPLIVRAEASHQGALPVSKSFFSIEPANVILASVKKAEDSAALIFRIYEATGSDSRFTLALPANVSRAQETNLLEEPDQVIAVRGNMLEAPVGHYEIKTIKVDL